VDVRDDPRDSRKRIVFLYDISEIHDLRQLLKDKARFCDIVGKSGPMEQVFQLIRDVAKYDATVLIEGETGTGKELVARAIHASSNRRDGPFIVMNCAGLSDTLINSQLFGHKKGAFTDAIRDQEGLFEAANNGTIVLDEIGDIPLNTQTRILRVLEQREIVRIGETQPRTINIRILAATNKDLAAEVSKGNFRLDLLYRIRVARIRLPPLRERREDIPLLTASFLSQFRVAAGKSVETVDEEAMRLFLSYRWPGNVRELRNAIEFAVIRCRGSTIKVEDLPPEITDVQLAVQGARSYEVNEEKERIRKALDACSGRRAEAAKLLGVSRATLYRRMRACFLADRDSDKTRA
jgi:transcriptional regulator with PAS, ATPase and Fis domain